MALVTGDSFGWIGRVLDTATTVLSGEGTIASAQIGDQTFVYVSSRADSAIQVYTLDIEGQFTPVTTFQPGPLLGTLTDIEVVDVGGTPFLVVATDGANLGATIYALSAQGPHLTQVHQDLTSFASFGTPGTVNPLNVEAVTGSDGVPYLLFGGFETDLPAVFSIDASGITTLIAPPPPPSFTSTFDGPLVGGQMVRGTNRHSEAVDFFFTEVQRESSPGTYQTRLYLAELQPGGVVDLNRTIDVTSVPEPAGAVIVPFGDDLILYTLDAQAGRITVDRYTVSASSPTLQNLHSYQSAQFDGMHALEVVSVNDQPMLAVRRGTDMALFALDLDEFSATPGAIRPVPVYDAADPGPGALEGPGHVVEVEGATFVLTLTDQNDLYVYQFGGLDDTVTGTQTADTLLGLGGDDVLYGLSGNDELFGGPGDDVLFAGAGKDILRASQGRDANYGGSGFDTFDGRALSTATLGVTIDLLRSEVLLPDGQTQIITGFERAIGGIGADVLIGDDLDNVLQGNEGNDLMRGREGADELTGNDGADEMYGAGGDDILRGGNGADRINGGDGADRLEGGAADDLIFAGNGDDLVFGGTENDLLKGNGGNDVLNGGAGHDTLVGQSGDDTLSGGEGDDLLQGGSGRDRLIAAGGNDTLTGGSAADEFVFTPVAAGGGGTNSITDFKDGIDTLDLRDYALTASAVLSQATQQGNAVEISFADGQIVRLEQFALSDLDATDLLL